MNDDKFINEALKEHARHEGHDDQVFLDQLEAKLNEQEQVIEVNRERRKRKSSSKAGWISAVALFMMGATVAALFHFNRESGRDSGSMSVSEMNYSSEEGQMMKLDVPPPQGVLHSKNESKPGAPSERMSNVIAANSTSASAPNYVKPVGRGEIGVSRDDRGFRNGLGGRLERLRGRPVPETLSGNKYGQLIDQGFLSPLKAPLSTFSVDVDTASYTNIRKHVESGLAIDPNAVRIEEMINYFDYNYAGPTDDHPFAVHTEVAACPWNPKHRLVKIGLKGKEVKDDRKAANLVFLIDVSGSMNNSDKLPLLVQSFELLLTSLNENDSVSLVVYAGRQAVLLKPTSVSAEGRGAISRALKNLSAGGSTNGAAGISTAYDLARSGFIEGGVNRVILATDGDFNVGTTSQSELLKLVKNQAEGQISLTILGFGQGNLNDGLMEQLTNRGDGNYFYLDSLGEAQKVFQHKLTGTIETIAKDVKIQVDFNPGKVAQYRLIGYANRRLKDEDFANDKIDAGDIGAGHTVTALYEVIPVGVEPAKLPRASKYQRIEPAEPARKIVDSPELLTVKLRYKAPDGDVSTELSKPLTDENKTLGQASDDLRFASSVALWGMLLRNSEHAGDGNPDLASQLALGGKGEDLKGERIEFLDLLRKWSASRVK
jgi:Ca-activated chloride channel family protein